MRAAVRSAAAALWLAAAGPAAAVEPHDPPSLIGAIELWLAANFGLAPAAGPPALVTVPARRLVEIRYGPASPVPAGDVMAVYDDASRTIYLAEGWTGRTPAQLSVLVHEMVHHLQSSAGLPFACPAERERLAYRAQDEWLRLFGMDLETAFDIDPALVLVATVCTH